MVASSVATYLDVTHPTSVGSEHGSVAADPQTTAQAAKVLAAINEGAATLKDISSSSGLGTAETITALSWLEKAQLIKLSEADNGLRVELTPPAIAALKEA